jgi:hypothetical protein
VNFTLDFVCRFHTRIFIIEKTNFFKNIQQDTIIAFEAHYSVPFSKQTINVMNNKELENENKI